MVKIESELNEKKHNIENLENNIKELKKKLVN